MKSKRAGAIFADIATNSIGITLDHFNLEYYRTVFIVPNPKRQKFTNQERNKRIHHSVIVFL